MKRRDFIELAGGTFAGATLSSFTTEKNIMADSKRKIVAFGAGTNPPFLNYIAKLTGKNQPRLCFLPTASADSQTSIISWYETCAALDVKPFVQKMFINSYDQKQSFEEVTTDSRPKEISKVNGLGFIKASHCPHYDSEPTRRPLYHSYIKSKEFKAGYACDDRAAIYFEDNEVKQVITTKEDSNAYYVYEENGKVIEKKLPKEVLK